MDIRHADRQESLAEIERYIQARELVCFAILLDRFDWANRPGAVINACRSRFPRLQELNARHFCVPDSLCDVPTKMQRIIKRCYGR